VATLLFERFFSCLALFLAISCSVGTRPSFAVSFVTLLDSDLVGAKAAADVGAGVGSMGAVVGGAAVLSLALFLLKE